LGTGLRCLREGGPFALEGGGRAVHLHILARDRPER
jgi:hypothetical protein